MKFSIFFAGLLAGGIIGYFGLSSQHRSPSGDETNPKTLIEGGSDNGGRECLEKVTAESKEDLDRESRFRELRVEVERRLLAVESDYAAMAKSSADTEELMNAVTQAHKEYAINANEAAKEHEEYKKVIQSFDPIWMGREPVGFIDFITRILEEVSTENTELKARLSDEGEKGGLEN